MVERIPSSEDERISERLEDIRLVRLVASLEQNHEGARGEHDGMASF